MWLKINCNGRQEGSHYIYILTIQNYKKQYSTDYKTHTQLFHSIRNRRGEYKGNLNLVIGKGIQIVITCVH